MSPPIVSSFLARLDRTRGQSLAGGAPRRPPDRQAQAFPVLTPAQIDHIRPYGISRAMRAGEILFEPGELGMPCFVVLTGKLEILMTRLSGEHVLVTMVPEVSPERWS